MAPKNGPTSWRRHELFYKKIFLKVVNQAGKLPSQPVNLPGTWLLMKSLV